MNVDDFILRAARNDAEDAALFCALSNSLYARPVDPAYYRWQFFEAPFLVPFHMALAGNELAGCEAFQLRPAAQTGVAIAWAIDIMVGPSHRRRGLFRRLTASLADAAAPERPAALCVMANDRADRASVDGLGWRRVTTLVTQARSTESVPAVTRRLRLTPLPEFGPLGEALPRMQAHVLDRGRLFANRRTVEWLDWRFVKNPRYRYECFLVERGGAVFAYLVLKIFRDPVGGAPFGDIVDVLWLEDDAAALQEILIVALEYFAAQGVPRAAMWLETNTALDHAGRDLGFAPLEQKRYFCVKVLDDRDRTLERADRWFLTMADAEVY